MRLRSPRHSEWRPWFAWRPVRVTDREKAWLEIVLRRRYQVGLGTRTVYMPIDRDAWQRLADFVAREVEQ